MSIGMNIEQFLVALVLSVLASPCYAADSKSLPPEKRDAESSSPAKAAAKASPPANAVAKSSPAVTNGARVYTQYCQACHMTDGKGAIGAGTYPALAKNEKLKTASYPVVVVLYGKAGMPWFNGLLTPAEIAAVVGYVRTNFGNNYAEPVTTEEVAKMSGPVPKDE